MRSSILSSVINSRHDGKGVFMAVTWLAEASRPRADATARDKTAAIKPSSAAPAPDCSCRNFVKNRMTKSPLEIQFKSTENLTEFYQIIK